MRVLVKYKKSICLNITSYNMYVYCKSMLISILIVFLEYLFMSRFINKIVFLFCISILL